MKRSILTLLMWLILMFPIITKAETIDTTPPIISSIIAETTEYNVGDTVSLIVDVSDDISGIYFVNVILAPKDDINNLNSLITIHNSNLKNGVSVISSNINFGVKTGKYVIRMIQVSDWATNIKYFANDNVEKMPGINYSPLPFKNVEISVTNNSTDKTAPIISNIKINKNQFNVGEKLIITMEMTDESDIKNARLNGDYGGAGFRNIHDNIYQAEILLKKPGTLNFSAIEVSDIYNNSKRYTYKNSSEQLPADQKIIEDGYLDILVTGEEDETPPTIKSVEINKKEVYKAYIFTLTFLPGILSIFYGDEIGIQGIGNLANRKPYPWGKEDLDLLNYFKYIGSIRKEESFLQEANLNILDINKDYFMFERYTNTDRILTTINRTNEEIEFPVPREYKSNKKVYTLNKSTKGYLSPYGGISIKR